MNMKFIRTLIAAALGAAALVEFFFYGDGAAHVGVTLMFLILLGGFLLAVGLPKRGEKQFGLQVFLTTGVILVALSFTLFDTPGLIVINFQSLIVMMGILFLQRACGDLCGIGEKGFLPELFAGYVLRPLLSVAEPFKEMREISTDSEHSGDGQTGKRLGKVIVQIVLALLVSIPLILVLSLLLAQSDAVFGNFVEEVISGININIFTKLFGRVFLFLMIMPFAASVVWSYRIKKLHLNNGSGSFDEKTTHIPSLSAIIVLGLVNILYLIYAAIQSVYLFGAWAGDLPGNLTYAEYARSGFFELAFISVLNAGMILLTIRYTTRVGSAGKVIRGLSVLLLALSTVQLASALRRMFLYMEAYGLSESRYLVTAFMFLMAILFVFLLVKELKNQFPLLKFGLIACVTALVLVNYSVPGFWIAKTNIDRYLDGNLPKLDATYLTGSADSIRVVLENEDRIIDKINEDMMVEMDEFHAIVDSNYFGRHDHKYPEYHSIGYEKEIADNWKIFNLSKIRVLVSAD